MSLSRRICSHALIIIAAIANTVVASARPLPADYEAVGVGVPEGGAVPASAAVVDEWGQRRALDTLLTQPTVLVFADYTCRTLCGPAVAFVVAALEESRLRAGEQFRVLVIGIDPKDSAADAATMRRDQVGESPVGNALAQTRRINCEWTSVPRYSLRVPV